jgi:uncharacterized coiled-coil DUF342 family protein
MTMADDELSIEILKGIRDLANSTRDEFRGTFEELRAEIRGTNARIDDTNSRLGVIERRQVDSEIRIATELVALAGAVREVRDTLREDRASRGRLDDHERRIVALEKRKS